MRNQKNADIYGSLLKQLVFNRGADESQEMKELRAVYRKHKQDRDRELKSESAADRIFRDYETLLATMGKLLNRVYVVIDGFEQCQGRDRLLESLKRLGAHAPINVFISSRPEPDILEGVAELPTINIDKLRLNQSDIDRHIDWHFEHDGELKDITPTVKQKMQNDIKSKSNGMYVHLKVAS